MEPSKVEIKRFVASTMSRALEMVRNEMGPEAVIISSKKVNEGVEVVTSVDLDLPTRGISERRAFGQNFDADVDYSMESDSSWQSQAGIEHAASMYPGQVEINTPDPARQHPIGKDIAVEIERAREKMIAAKKAAKSEANAIHDGRGAREETVENKGKGKFHKRKGKQGDSSAGAKNTNEQMDTLRGEIADLRMLLQQQLWQGKPEHVLASPYEFSEPSHTRTNSDSSMHTAAGANTAQTLLCGHLRRLSLSETITSKLLKHVDPAARVSENWKNALGQIARIVPIADNMDVNNGGIFAMLGSTGVGKTTTLAKLAARYSLKHGPGKVALISMDTHRVGAAEQMRSFGRIIEAPVRVVDDQTSLMTMLTGLRDFPLVLIDTAGFRHGDPNLKEQQRQFDENPQVRRLLVLSSLSQYQSLKASVHAYGQRPGMDACVLSKLDEAIGLGEALSVVIEHKQALAYVTDGQQIPKDLHIASRHSLVANAVHLAKENHVRPQQVQ